MLKFGQMMVLLLCIAACTNLGYQAVASNPPQDYQLDSRTLRFPEYGEHVEALDPVQEVHANPKQVETIKQQLQEDEKQITCMAYNIYYEGRNQDEKGQIAIGNVVLNRIKDPRFPKTVCEVVHDKFTKKSKDGKKKWTVYEFSWVKEHGNKAPELDEKYLPIRDLASNLYYGLVKDNTRGALFYHTKDVHPIWDDIYKHTVTIGHHLFFTAAQKIKEADRNKES